MPAAASAPAPAIAHASAIVRAEVRGSRARCARPVVVPDSTSLIVRLLGAAGRAPPAGGTIHAEPRRRPARPTTGTDESRAAPARSLAAPQAGPAPATTGAAAE